MKTKIENRVQNPIRNQPQNQAQNPIIPWIEQKTKGMRLEEYRLLKLRETVGYAKERSLFYKESLKAIDEKSIKSLSDFEKLPMTGIDDILHYGDKMLCVHPGEVERIVTLFTSGTTGEPKRVYFTKEDQELTIDFFHHGMKCLIGKEDRFLILLPCLIPGSVGNLLSAGLKRLGCETHSYGLVTDIEKACEYIKKHRITSLAANPVQALKLAEAGRKKGYDIRLNSILLSTDYVPEAIIKRLSQIWGASVYEHYGTTESGLGGGVFCSNLCGYHMREADLYFEIVTPEGKAVSDGEYGEIVFTTLTRKAMPLIRYKTGDIGRFKKEKCPCGNLRLMEKVRRRKDGGVKLKNGRIIFIDELDEIIFSFDKVTDYEAQMIDGELEIRLYCEGSEKKEDITKKVTEFTGVNTKITVKEQEGILSGPLMKRKFI